MNMPHNFDQAKLLILAAKNILIISHKSPDPDTVGANLALREAIERLGKNVSSASIDPIPENCKFLKNADKFIRNFNSFDFDLIIAVDCGGHKLLGFEKEKPELLDRKSTKMINIDHHISNDNFGNLNIVIPNAPATCFILFFMCNYFGWGISQNMATALLTGIYYDTGSFMHSNTTPEALRIAARLKAAGAELDIITKHLFRISSINKLRLWGKALSKLDLSTHKAAVTALTNHDYKETKTDFEDISGLIAYINQTAEAKFSMLIAEDNKGNIKTSFRTQEDEINLSELAQLFGGGGHKKAAGFTIPGHLKEKLTWELC